MGLRKGQKELVEDYRGGYCAVPAIPGGGKTYCLSVWAARMIAMGIPKPGKILIVTYMNSAVNNFKQRISAELQRLGIQGNKGYFVSTIHGLCLQIIKEKPDHIIANEEFGIVDEVTKVQIINSAVDEWKRGNERRLAFFIDEQNFSSNKLNDIYKTWHDKFCGLVLGAIGDFKCRGIGPQEALERCKSLPNNSFLRCASEVYGLYDRKLKISGFLDFDDMLYSSKKILMEDSSLLEKYQKKYTFVCEDEAQDSNLIQSEILTMLANGNLLRVGDSNQAICGSFSNSDFTLFKSFCEDPATTVYNITQSSRNTKDIINLANHFVKYIRERHPILECRDSLLPQYIEPVSDDDERKNPEIPEYGIKAGIFPSWQDEARRIVKKAQEFLNLFPDKTAAILAPSAWKIKEIVKILGSWDLPYEQLDNSSPEKNKTVRMLGRVIDYIAYPEDGEKLAAMMLECFLTERYDADHKTQVETENDIENEGQKRIGQKDMLTSFLKRCPTENLLYPQGGEINIRDIPRELSKSTIWSDFLSYLDLVRELLEFPDTIVEKLILYISEKLKFGREERAIAQKVAGDVRYLMSRSPVWRMGDLALELLSPKNMFNYFAGVVYELKGYEPKPGVITVATYHKSKGLEWDVVFLTGLNYADFPVTLKDKFIGEYWFLREEYKNPQAVIKAEMQKKIEGSFMGDPLVKAKIETISEKARLLYVGITRAKQYLFLSGEHSNQGKRNEVLPCQYLVEIKKFIDEEGSK
ncbi:MAG TPA: ATP-dependent helicase [Pseudobacteroides sp.]|uniref:ATP-dependent helicase n=1 Tax=Pseudobacteroides sp. TaxID=1968840 RepID=UPI002F92BB49